MYPFFEIFGKTVGSYALLGFVGLFISTFIAQKLLKRINFLFEDVILTVLVIGVGMLIGGHLLYAVTNSGKIAKCFIFILNSIKSNTFNFSIIVNAAQICFGGSVFYGGFIGSVIALVIYNKNATLPVKKTVLDVFAVCVPLFHTFGRIGCFLGGCCYGIESKFGFTAHNDLLPEMSGVNRFPIALVESLFNLILFIILLYLFNKKSLHGKLIYLYTLIYAIGRFIFEFFRGDVIRGVFFHLSTSQWISIVFFISSSVILTISNKNAHKKRSDF